MPRRDTGWIYLQLDALIPFPACLRREWELAVSLLGRANLLTRILILVVVATLPAVLVLAYLQHDLRMSRHERLSAEVLRQAELVAGDVGNIITGARQLAVAISHYRTVGGLDPACRRNLLALQADLPAYAALAVLREDGAVVCSTIEGTNAALSAAMAALVMPALARREMELGVLVPAGAGYGPVLPVAVGFRGADGQAGVVVAALDVDWMGAQLATIRHPPGMTLLIADRDGVIVAAHPDRALFVGRALPRRLMERMAHTAPGTAVVPGADGNPRLIGYIPPGGMAEGLFVSVGQATADLVADLDRATWQGSLLVFVGALLSLWLALLVGERFVRQPAAALTEAARRWAEGDLQARAHLGEPAGSEFGRLAAAFNTMAAAMATQRAELEALNATLEARAEERNRDLLESRNRLQVETAERERTEGELRQAQKLQAVGQLAGGIAHDFNNLLTAVTGALELLRRRLPPGEAGQLRLVEHALSAAERGGKLTGQLLSFSRRQRLLAAATDVNASLVSLHSLLAGALGRSVRIETELAEGLWPAMVDPNQFEAAMLNLAINARDAMAEGGVLTISTRNVQVPADLPAGPGMRAGAYVAVQVRDSGSGRSADVLGRAFEPFFTTKPPGSGSGLGLSQVHGLAVQSGGDARIASRPGEGTVVTLLLPRAAAAAAAVPAKGRPGGRHSRGVHILVVDDDRPVRDMIAALLVERGHQVSTAEDGASGLAALQRDLAEGGSIEILLADFVMPGMNGLVLIRAAQALRPGLKALLVTGHAEFRSSDNLRPEQVMRKPFTLAQMDQRIETLLAEGRALAPAAE